MDKLRIFILDSNQKELDFYAELCRAIAGQNGAQAEVSTYASGKSLLLDLQDSYKLSTLSILIVEPDGGGQAIPRTARKLGFKGLVVYLSRLATEECFLQAFDAGAVQFLKKGPSHVQRFHTVFKKILRQAENLYREYIVVSGYGEYKQIQIGNIHYFEAHDKLMTVHYAGGKFEFFSTLQKLEEQLADRGFVRVSKSYLVSMECIHKFSYERMIINDGTEIAVGRRYYPALKAAMDRR